MKSNDPLALLAKKRRRKTFFMTIVFSLLATLLLFALCFKLLSNMTAKNGQKVYNDYQQLAEIAYPNISYNSLYYFPTGQFSGKVHADRFKDLDGIPVAYSPFEANYSLTGAFNAGASDVFSKNKLLYDRGNLQKIPQFYNTKVKFSKNDVKTSPSQDLKYLNQLNDKVIEVAITFDKPYTYKEIKTMLPKNLKQNWLWIGTYTTLDTSQWPNQFGTDTENIHSAINTMFNVSKNSPHVGINNVNIYSDLDNYLKDNKHIKDVDQLSFAGIILTGKSENFNSLKGKKWIYGSSLGASIDYQPYYQLDVE
ncbi:sigma factor regulator N-terminal domain-containing protein [Streptococcus uberis]|uniref:sigma factor regulator N-terminal domain-containing protein n=1 Tax=Streptococcus uberis TaxID=1349 RepID=UPI003D6ADB8E